MGGRNDEKDGVTVSGPYQLWNGIFPPFAVLNIPSINDVSIVHDIDRLTKELFFAAGNEVRKYARLPLFDLFPIPTNNIQYLWLLC